MHAARLTPAYCRSFASCARPLGIPVSFQGHDSPRFLFGRKIQTCCSPTTTFHTTFHYYSDRADLQKLIAASNPDVFGDVAEAIGAETSQSSAKGIRSNGLQFETSLLELADSKPHIRLSRYHRKHEPAWYGKRIEELGRKGKIKEAINMFEKEMIEQDRVRPDVYTYTCLIAALGRVGYTKKAFSLFNQMKKIGLQPSAHIYTSLFNSCALSPWTQDGLRRATKLRAHMASKGFQPNVTHYMSMLRAFVVCGDPTTAFGLIDEMASRGITMNGNAYSFLLMACVGDKRAGFSLLIQVWRMMIAKGVAPSHHTYNLLLQCTKECSAGDPTTFAALLSGSQPAQGPALLFDGDTDSLSGSESDQDSDGEDEETSWSLRAKESRLPAWSSAHVQPLRSRSRMLHSEGLEPLSSAEPMDVLNPEWTLAAGQALPSLVTRSDRLVCLGGIKGVLERMERDGVKPDVKTLTSFAQLLGPDAAKDFADILEAIDKFRVEVDVDLFNAVIREFRLRRMHEDAKGTLREISSRGLYPNLRTFACLAINLTDPEAGMQLLRDMASVSVTPEPVVFNTLLKHAGVNFVYIKHLLREMTNCGAQPNEGTLRVLMSKESIARGMIFQQEKRRKSVTDKSGLPEDFEENFEQYKIFCEQWLKDQPAPLEDHPWAAFQTEDSPKDKTGQA